MGLRDDLLQTFFAGAPELTVPQGMATPFSTPRTLNPHNSSLRQTIQVFLTTISQLLFSPVTHLNKSFYFNM
jgi:hypothetical protein